jgi:hypothetical protein
LTALNAKSLATPIKGKRLRGKVASILRSAGADDEVIEQTESGDGLALAEDAEEAEDE